MYGASWTRSVAVCSLLLAAVGCREDGGGGTGTNSTEGTASGDGTGGTTASDGETDTGGGGTSDTASSSAAPECGNGVVEEGEECDDGNAESLDGCEPGCTSSSGLEIWTVTHDGPASKDDWISEIAAAPDGALLLAGYQQVEAESINVWLRKMDTDGEEVWTVSRDVGASVGPDTPDALGGVAVDADGNIAVAGRVRVDKDTNDWDIWIAMYDPDGTELWTGSYVGPDAGADSGNGVAFDASGNVIVVGGTETIAQEGDGWMRKLDPGGQELWTQTFNGPADGNDGLAAVATNGDTIIVVGSETGESGLYGARIAAHDADGVELWRTNEVNELDGNMLAYGVALDGDGAVHVSGRTYNAYDYYDVWIAKYDSGGAPIWSTLWSGASLDYDSGNGIVVADTGNVFVAGTTVFTNQLENIFAGSWDGNGDERWVDSYDGELSLTDAAGGVALDGDGFVYIVGGETVMGQGTNGWIRKYYP